jgi:hypothetical protein
MKLKRFEKFITETKDQETIDDLIGLGLVDLDFDEKWQRLVGEWGDDPKIQETIQTLKDQTQTLIDKWIDLQDPEDEQGFDKMVERISAESPYDLGWLEFTILASS